MHLIEGTRAQIRRQLMQSIDAFFELLDEDHRPRISKENSTRKGIEENMNLEFVKYEKREHIAYITFNRPERMNALHPACHVEMTKVWDDFIADKAMWVAIVTGAGDKAFSAGNDLRYTAEHRGEPVSEVLRKQGRLRGNHRRATTSTNRSSRQ